MIDPIKADTTFISIVESPIESRSVEFKPSVEWRDVNSQNDIQKIIKSIIGMSNVKDIGRIILGVPQKPDRTFEIKGMDPEHMKSYEQDNIYQDVRKFTNPSPHFEVSNVEWDGKFFIVFTVYEFLYSPIICIKNGKNNGAEPLVAGAFYIRTHKPETKKVDKEEEMREIINLAVDKEFEILTPRVKQLIGSKIRTQLVSDDEKFKKELEDLKL